MLENKVVILHVDDDEANRYAVTRSLLKAGFAVEEAADGATAIKKMAQNPDLVILDVRLPDIDGVEVCRRIKADSSTASVPVLHLSAHAISGQDKAHGLDTGADAYLIRPVDPVELIATVNALLRIRRAETAQRDIATKLEQQSRIFDTLLSSISDFAYTLDRNGRFLYANQALLQLWGLSLQDAIGKNFSDLKYPTDLAEKLQRQLQEVFTTAKQIRDEAPYISPRGLAGYYEYIFSPVLGADGQVELIAGSTRDMSARRLMEEELITARDAAQAANRAKDEFLAVLSHELRTPLSPVVMTISELEQRPDLPHDVQESMSMIRRNIDLETRLIDDLLDLSRVVSGKLHLRKQRVHLHDVLRHAYEVSVSDFNARRIKVIFELNAADDWIEGDPTRLQQVFWNLIKNAVKFSSEGQNITVRTANVSPFKIRVQVMDHGIGISSEALPGIFGAFDQGDARTGRRFGGLGLGLAISRAVLDMHGGTIEASSKGAGEGTTLTVEMQSAAFAAAPSGESPAVKNRTEPNTARILFVEDHLDTARVMSRLLVGLGYTVSLAHTVSDALKLADNESFDIVISDIGLPDASGYELMTELKSRHHLKGIALSGYGMDEDVRRGHEAGFVDYVTKPITISQLEAAIKRTLCDQIHRI